MSTSDSRKRRQTRKQRDRALGGADSYQAPELSEDRLDQADMDAYNAMAAEYVDDLLQLGDEAQRPMVPLHMRRELRRQTLEHLRLLVLFARNWLRGQATDPRVLPRADDPAAFHALVKMLQEAKQEDRAADKAIQQHQPYQAEQQALEAAAAQSAPYVPLRKVLTERAMMYLTSSIFFSGAVSMCRTESELLDLRYPAVPRVGEEVAVEGKAAIVQSRHIVWATPDMQHALDEDPSSSSSSSSSYTIEDWPDRSAPTTSPPAPSSESRSADQQQDALARRGDDGAGSVSAWNGEESGGVNYEAEAELMGEQHAEQVALEQLKLASHDTAKLVVELRASLVDQPHVVETVYCPIEHQVDTLQIDEDDWKADFDANEYDEYEYQFDA